MDLTNGVDMTIKIKEGFKFNGFDTTENDMYLISRSAPTPAEKEIIENIPFAHGVYDFSNILGERIFDNRTISYSFQIYEHDYEQRKHEQTVLQNKLMNTHITRLEDTHDSSYYYLGKCVSVGVEDDHEYGRLIVNIDFDCYPFKISKLPEGHDIWDEFNFELDVAQETEFEAQSDWSQFKELSIGEQATYGAWATQYMHPTNETGGGNKIQPEFLGRTYRIIDKRTVDQSSSKLAYKLAEVDEWLLEQDVLQAQTQKTEGILFNPGTPSITPTITTTNKITIIKGNNIYNLMPGTYKDQLFRLSSGANPIEIYAHQPATIEFDFHKELI